MAGKPDKFKKEFKTIQEIANYAQLYGDRVELWFVRNVVLMISNLTVKALDVDLAITNITGITPVKTLRR